MARANPELCDSSKLSVDYKHLYIYTCIKKKKKKKFFLIKINN